MRYMGGKFRQSKAIVQCLKPYFNDNTVYVEPFAGGLNSAARVARELHPRRMILNDDNQSLILMHEKCYKEGVDWLPLDVSRDTFNKYKATQPMDDPLTAWIGIGYCLMSDWYHSYAPYVAEGTKRGHERCMQWLRCCDDVAFTCSDYRNFSIPDDAVVYCDPPYDAKGCYHNKQFDISTFWQWARDLSKRCTVFVSCFSYPPDFEEVHSWGDTVSIKHRKTGAEKRRVENERLVRYCAAQKGKVQEDSFQQHRHPSQGGKDREAGRGNRHEQSG